MSGPAPQYLIPLRAWSGQRGIWRDRHCELSHEDPDQPDPDGWGIGCVYNLEVTTLLSGETKLTNGLHRWVVDAELGVDVVPVKMRHETEPVWAWPAAAGDYCG